ncbi:MAG: DUF1761 domain-containing protein [Steroidobacteraceae bacterium]
MVNMSTVNWLAVAVAAVAGFPLGMIWYGPLFGKAWMRETGVTEEKARSANPAKLYGTVLVLNLIAAWSMALVIGLAGWRTGLHVGLMIALTFVAVALGINYLFEFRTLRLWLINSGYMVVFFSVMGLILGAWH